MLTAVTGQGGRRGTELVLLGQNLSSRPHWLDLQQAALLTGPQFSHQESGYNNRKYHIGLLCTEEG